MAKANNNEISKMYHIVSLISTIILFAAVLTYVCGFVHISERIFILFIFTFGFELGVRLSKILGV